VKNVDVQRGICSRAGDLFRKFAYFAFRYYSPSRSGVRKTKVAPACAPSLSRTYAREEERADVEKGQ
jgi:hypothetical protein